MATFRGHLQDLHLYFHHSANRTAALKAAASTLGLTDLKMKVYCLLHMLRHSQLAFPMYSALTSTVYTNITLVYYFQEVKDTRWLSQHLAIEILQRNLTAVLATLVEEAEIKRCPIAKGLYTFCATYRFVALVHLQADILPHLARLSKVFQLANVNFLHIKEQVCNDWFIMFFFL